jgi:queuine tRNA-ribosyltransferase
VLPTRVARNDAALTRSGRLNLRNAPFAEDERPIDPDCRCYTCRHFSRAYLRHLIIAHEMLSASLLSIHNLHTLIQLAADLRQAVLESRLPAFVQGFYERRAKGEARSESEGESRDEGEGEPEGAATA